jgi:hypothetical protein
MNSGKNLASGDRVCGMKKKPQRNEHTGKCRLCGKKTSWTTVDEISGDWFEIVAREQYYPQFWSWCPTCDCNAVFDLCGYKKKAWLMEIIQKNCVENKKMALESIQKQLAFEENARKGIFPKGYSVLRLFDIFKPTILSTVGRESKPWVNP